MKPEAKRYSATIGGKEIIIETGLLAGQAGGAVTVRQGDTMVFASATISSSVREGIDFFPLSVDYEERMYAGGRIPGSFFRREGRPTEEAILTARLTDRPLRPLFPKDMRNDVQVLLYSFSVDGVNPIDMLAINAASAALMISDAPWGGPVGATRVALVDGQLVANPSYEDMARSELDLRLAGTRDAILMVECGAKEVPEATMVAALELGHQAILPIIEVQERMAAEIGKAKIEYTHFAVAEELKAAVSEKATARMTALLDGYTNKADMYSAVDELRAKILAEMVSEESSPTQAEVASAYDSVYKSVVRSRILNQGIRPDGRNSEQIRPIWCDVNFSPRAHGSGLFTRGETQVLTLATLGSPRDAQELDNLSATEPTKRYMHHYNFPPFSTGEVRPLRGASRRDIGHGALAERALLPVIPPEGEFPYTMRLVSEVLASNGSSSMASVCGSTLALMDTGVPIKAPVAGVAMGLIKEGEQYAVLTDIQGVEDHLGDMDFKVAGTRQGITALQMDIKIKGLSAEIMAQALEQARKARLNILEQMLAVLANPRPELKPFVPRITTVKIPVDKIGAVIGPGGKMIRSIQEETKTQIDIGEDGTVFISAVDGDGERMARERILGLTETAQIGRIYTGKVVRVTDFGAFVEIIPGTDGMVHISQLDTERVNRVEDIANVGDEITVMVTDIDPAGKIRLSRQAVLEGWTAEEAISKDRGGRPSGGGGRPGGGRPGGGRPGGDRDRGGYGGGRGGGGGRR